MIKSANRTQKDMWMESCTYVLKSSDWSTGNPKYVSFCHTAVVGMEADDIFDKEVETVPGTFVYLVECSVEDDRATAVYSTEKFEAPKSKKKAKAKKVKKEDILPLEETVEILQEEYK